GWTDLARVIIVGTLAYAGLVAMLRISGKRTLSKMNAFDFVVTVALGSTLATVLLSKDVLLLEGLLALGLLCMLQYAVAFLSVRSNRFQSLVKAEPRLLFHHGNFLRTSMRAERVAEEEILAAIRSEDHTSLERVDSVVLETDGSFSVTATTSAARDAMRTVQT
ncbi:MAG TPA: YetF domain-containing protein, partial [Methylomirabilota bacterium]|nr:YetF domain-containing protein [Methylomirabilota bacterium]